jgi:TetR/AcrR family transcriptional regulator, transcriptional repressor for nem operon
MRYRPGHKDETRVRILRSASKRFRETGYAAAGLNDIMKSADLTVGGFYAHFESKEDLLAAALEMEIDRTTAAFLKDLEGFEGEDWLREVARRYLSRTHRDHVADGCPVPAIAADVARSSPEVRDAFERSIRACLTEMTSRIDAARGLDSEGRALAAMSTLIGGILLARAVRDAALSDRILRACRLFTAPPEETS